MNIFEKIMKDLNELLLDVDAWSVLGIIFAILFVILTIGLASALSSKAEQAGSCPKINFFLGLVLPVVYPVLALLFMFKDESTKKKAKSKKVKVEEAADEESVEDGDKGEEFNKDYFFEMNNRHRDSVFYRFTLEDNESLTIFKIVECLPEVLVVIIIDEENEKHRMRVPYHKIDSVEIINKY